MQNNTHGRPRHSSARGKCTGEITIIMKKTWIWLNWLAIAAADIGKFTSTVWGNVLFGESKTFRLIESLMILLFFLLNHLDTVFRLFYPINLANVRSYTCSTNGFGRSIKHFPNKSRNHECALHIHLTHYITLLLSLRSLNIVKTYFSCYSFENKCKNSACYLKNSLFPEKLSKCFVNFIEIHGV